MEVRALLQEVLLNPTVLRVLICLLPLPVLVASLLVGPSDVVEPAKLASWLLSKLPFGVDSAPVNEPLLRAILIDVRLPRILTTFSWWADPWEWPGTGFRHSFATPWSTLTSSGSHRAARLEPLSQ